MPSPYTDIAEATEIVSSISRECEDAALRLEEIRLDPELFDQVRIQSGTSFSLIKEESLICKVMFVRA